MYAVLDIETTGGQYNQEGITDIAIYRFNGLEVEDQFISLVNPEQKIQDFVVKLTGINNKMLRNAPKFFEVAKRIVEITQGCILVGHNVNFDYRMLRTEFRRLGFDYQRDTVCTLELSQRLIPGKESYSLGKLARSLGIPVTERHRAQGDALATLEIFKLLLNKDTSNEIIKTSVKQYLNDKIPFRLLTILENLPAKMGVYFAYDSQGNLLLFEETKNIRKAVNQRFISPKKQDIFFQRNVQNIAFELSGNEIIAKLKYLELQPKLQPKIKRKQRLAVPLYGVFSGLNELGYIQLQIKKIENNWAEAWWVFPLQKQAKEFLLQLQQEYELPAEWLGIAHWGQKIKIPAENSQIYNKKLGKILADKSLKNKNLVLVSKGRTPQEKSILYIQNGFLFGYGFAQLNYQINHREIVKDIVTPVQNLPQVAWLVQQYFLRTKNYKIIQL